MITEIESHREHGFGNIVGKSETLHRILTNIETVAPTNATVFDLWRDRNGKELMARASLSLRRKTADRDSEGATMDTKRTL